MIRTLRDGFYRFGWLVPVFLPLAQIGGRALVNVTASVYLAWAIIAVAGVKVRYDRTLMTLYAAIPIAFLVSLWGAADLSAGFEAWFKFTTHISVFLFTWVALQRVGRGVPRLITTWGVVAFLTVALLYLVLPWFLWRGEFDPTQQLKEDNLPFLLPFGLLLLSCVGNTFVRRASAWVLVAIVLFYVVLSQGRAALLAMVVALLFYGVLTLRLKAWQAAGVTLLALLMGVILGYGTFFRGMEHATSIEGAVDRFSSERTVLWRHAVENPPENLVTGIGIGNLQQGDALLHANGVVVGHLHNFILDVWYETGFLGLAALSLFIGYVLLQFARAAPHLGRSERDYAGVALAAVAAIMIGALLSFSYGSLQFDVYMFMLLALLAHLSASAGKDTGPPA